MSIRKLMRLRETTGDVGLEIEVEGSNLPHTGEHWIVTQDGSLRGESCEYVLRRPKSLPEAREALGYLAHRYKENGAQIADSPRCGVHVHVNCQQLTVVQLYNFMVLYLILEDLLVRWCGEEREGNLFCLRAKDAEYLLFVLEQALEDKSFRARFSSDELRYASMNVNALPRYGSLEFRAMRGTKDMDLIYRWAEVLVGLREQAKLYPNPVEIIMQMSGDGYENFLQTSVGDDMASTLMELCPDWEMLLQDGVRRSQDIAYAGDWGELASFPKRRVGGVTVSQDWDDDFPPTDL
jgi:hypothetical protein